MWSAIGARCEGEAEWAMARRVDGSNETVRKTHVDVGNALLGISGERFGTSERRELRRTSFCSLRRERVNASNKGQAIIGQTGRLTASHESCRKPQKRLPYSYDTPTSALENHL